MKKKLNRLFGLTMAAVLAAALAGCASGEGGGSRPSLQQGQEDGTDQASGTGQEAAADQSGNTENTGEEITLRVCWWGSQSRHDLTQQALDLYMKMHPNVKLEAEFTDWSGYWDKLATQAAGGGLPDIIQMDYSYLSQYAASKQLADLNDYLADGTIDRSQISDSIIESGTVDGGCYAVSLGSTAPMVLYDKETADAAGVTIPVHPTIEEYYDICQQIYDKTGIPSYYESGMTMIQYNARAMGKEIFSELMAGEAGAAQKHFEWVERLATAEFCIPADILSEKNPQVVDSMPINDLSTWNVFSFSNAFPSIYNACGGDRELGAFMYPVMSDNTAEPMYLKPAMFFSVTENSQYKEEAAKFVDWFVNSEECNEILKGERGVPANSQIAEMVKGLVNDTDKLAYDYVAEVNKVATAVDPPNPAGYSEVEAALTALVEDIRYGNKTGAEAAQEFVPNAQSILEAAK